VGSQNWEKRILFLISNFRHVLNVVCFLLGNSPASEFYMTTFRNTVPSSYAGRCTYPRMKMGQSVSKRRHIKFRRRGIIQEKTYNKRILVSSCPSVTLSVSVQGTSLLALDRFSLNFNIWEVFESVSRKIQVLWKSDKNNGYFT